MNTTDKLEIAIEVGQRWRSCDPRAFDRVGLLRRRIEVARVDRVNGYFWAFTVGDPRRTLRRYRRKLFLERVGRLSGYVLEGVSLAVLAGARGGR